LFSIRKIDVAVNLGDTFDVRGIIHTACLSALEKEWHEWELANIQQIILVGNHEQEDRDGRIHPLSVFGSRLNTIVDEPMTVGGMDFYPHLPVSVVTQELIKKNKKSYLAFVHWGIQGGKRNDSNVDDDGVPVKWLKGYRMVFSGHYHHRNEFENVQYVGSPLQQNFGEGRQEKGVIILDTSTMKQEFVPLIGTPKHYDVELVWEKGKRKMSLINSNPIVRMKDIGSGDFVRVFVKGDSEQVSGVKKEDLMKSIGAKDIKMERVVSEKAYSRLNIESKEIYNTEAIMEKYVDFVETSLDKVNLMKIGREILYGKA
jgi:DNA repair exonuclease SbcCD nuclease subunit